MAEMKGPLDKSGSQDTSDPATAYRYLTVAIYASDHKDTFPTVTRLFKCYYSMYPELLDTQDGRCDP